MKVIDGNEDIPSEYKGSFITIGNFDGIHLGHRCIFQKLVREAHRENRSAVLITFVPHPKMVLHPERRPFYLLTTIEEKIELLDALHLDVVMLIPFSLAYAQTTAESFVMDFLWKKLQVRKIFIGHDYNFGKDKKGNKDLLASLGKKLGFDVAVIDAVVKDGSVVSSTRIRKAILKGDVRDAALLLGRPYSVSGEVIEGKRRGASFGFPTANVRPQKDLLPARGVYAVVVKLEGKRYRGVLNIGLNPTFGDNEFSMEVHILDFTDDIYGKSLELLFIDRLREEHTFPGVEDLAEQIKEDITEARIILTKHCLND